MRVLFFTRLFYPHIGGVETHVLEVSKRLLELGHEVTIVAEEIHLQNAYNQNEVESAKFKGKHKKLIVYRVPVGNSVRLKKFIIWNWLWKNRALMENADVIHCHDVFFWYLPFRLLFPSKPVFTTFHGYETKYPPAKRAIAIRRLSERLSVGNICVGDFIQKWYGTRPDFVTYGGVIMPLEKDKVLDINLEKEKKPTITFVGRFAMDTGVLAYDKAIALLRKKEINVEWIVLGDGMLKNQIENATRIASSEQNIYPYIERGQIMFSSSYLSILQGFAAKKFVIAFYDNPLKKDYLEMTPFAKFLAIGNSPEKITQCVEEFLRDPKDAQRRIDDAFSWVKEQTWNNVTDIYLRLWQKAKKP